MTKALRVRLISKLALLAATATLVLGIASLVQAQQRFNTPDAAVEALIAAARSGDRKTVVSILGPGSQEITSSGDPVADDNIKQEFLTAYDAQHRIVSETGKPSVLVMGQNDWPFPIPLVQKDGQWSFDTAAGREEILARRIGRNELGAIKATLAFYDAQNEYADMYKDKAGQSVYAQKIVSSPGKKDGLYWPTSGSETDSPLGEAVASATQQGYNVDRRALSRLLLQDTDQPRAECARRRRRLRRARKHDRRLRACRLSGRIRQFRHHDLHHQQ